MDFDSLVSRLGFWVVLVVSAGLLVQVLPVQGSPLFLGASIAVVYFWVRTRASRRER
jgi:hypothetical protein